jgi:hypothetical protein
MRWLQRGSAVLGWLALAAVAALMILESAGTVGDRWRQALSEAVAWVARPSAEKWAVALLGGLLAVASVVVLLAQVRPLRRVVEGIRIDETVAGSTEVTAAALYRRIGHELARLDDVNTAKPVPHPRRLRFRLEIIDSGNLSKTAAAARAAIGPELWASLGMEPRPVDLLLTYRKSATPVTRKELLV